MVTTPSEHTIFVVDDDDAVRDSLKALLESVGLVVEVYGSCQEFLDAHAASRSGCLVLDIHLPDMSGLKLLEALEAGRIDIPAILITGCCDPTTQAGTLQAGAVALLEKPLEHQLLLETIERALRSHRRPRHIKRSQQRTDLRT